MTYMTWTKARSIGVPSVDEQHEELMHLINRLQESLHAHDDEDAVEKAFQRLTDCTWAHFRDEEKYFAGTDYPRAAIHARKHQHLMLILDCFRTGFDRAGQRVSIADQLNFLRDWLLDHIASEDRRLGDYLNAQELAKSPSTAVS